MHISLKREEFLDFAVAAIFGAKQITRLQRNRLLNVEYNACGFNMVRSERICCNIGFVRWMFIPLLLVAREKISKKLGRCGQELYQVLSLILLKLGLARFSSVD